MGLGTFFGVHNPKTTKKNGLCKFAQPGRNRNSRGPAGIGCLNHTGVNQNLGVYHLISFNLQPTGVEGNFLPLGWKTTKTRSKQDNSGQLEMIQSSHLAKVNSFLLQNTPGNRLSELL